MPIPKALVAPSKSSEKMIAAVAGPVKRTPPARIAAAQAVDEDDWGSFFFMSEAGVNFPHVNQSLLERARNFRPIGTNRTGPRSHPGVHDAGHEDVRIHPLQGRRLLFIDTRVAPASLEPPWADRSNPVGIQSCPQPVPPPRRNTPSALRFGYSFP